MSIPRVVVRCEWDEGGWHVSALQRDWSCHYNMDAVMVEVGGFRRRLPVVLAGRRPPADAPHAALCAGDEDALRPLLERVAASETAGDDVTGYGRWLFECLLAPAWETIRNLPDVVTARGVELALDWPVMSSDLHWLLWEAMHDGTAPLAGHRDLLVAITRLVPVDPDPPATIKRVPRVLFAAGSALTDQVIRPGAMFMGLLRKFDADELSITRTVQQVSVADLDRECATFRPDIVHLVAHGDHDDDGNGVVVLAQDRPGGGAVDADRLLTALTAGGRPVLVALSACHSGLAGAGSAPLAAQLVEGGIPIVSAMAGEVSEPACRLYIRCLVSAIHDGESAVEAVAHGRRAALLQSEHPASQIDWALPALFLARSVEPGFRVVDPAPAKQLVELADQLKLRRRPVYVGRREVFERVDELFAPDPGRRLGFVGVVRDGSIQRLGSTRLLREIGFRLLREGHVPLLLGPYSPYGQPTTLRTVLVEIFQKAVWVAEQLATCPPQVTALAADADFAAAGRVEAPALAGLPPDEACVRILETLSLFSETGHPGRPLAHQVVRARLAADLSALAETIGRAGEPFGPHTRVVVLADSLHTWANALDDLLAMVRKTGLGTTERPAPLIGTSSLSEGKGPALKTFGEEHSGMPGFAFPQLTALPDGEATLGFQWVLLHPWQHDRDPEYRQVYVCARGAPADRVHRHLRLLKGVPTKVEEELYTVAQSLWIEEHFLADDDDAAYRAYLETNP